MVERTPEIPEKPIKQEVVSEIPVQLPKKSNLSKIVLLFILGLVFLAGAIYAGVTIGKKQTPPEVIPQVTEVPPTPDETANWKTYTNTKHNYSFSYPKNYFLTAERLDGYDDMVVLHKLTEDTLEAYGKNLSRLTLLSEEGLIWNLVLTKPIVADLSLTIPKTCIKKNNSGGYLYYSCPDVLPPEPEIGKGNSVGAEFYVIGEQKVSGQNKMIFPMYLTRRNPPLQSGKFSNEEIKEIESIIDTFKFFPDVDETANWKTYKNEKYEFELKYPSDWLFEEKFSYADGFLISQNNSRLRILPRGEFDRGLPSVEPILTEELLDKRHTKVSKWVDNEETLILYHFTGIVPTNWVKCGDDLKNCNRLEISAKIKTDLDLLQTILSTFKFLD